MKTDKWYARLDPGIRFAVRVLHARGIETSQSCEGGDGHAYPRPTIDLYEGPSSSVGFAALHALEEYGLHVRGVSLLWRIHRGLPTEAFWRVTLREHCRERQHDLTTFESRGNP